ncbi:MAG: ankyrin repeat domain-containing protein [Ilumatobacteraceae bacterium]
MAFRYIVKPKSTGSIERRVVHCALLGLLLVGCSAEGVPKSVDGNEMSVAIDTGNVAKVVTLLRNGSDPNREDDSSNLPLVLAASTSTADVVAALLAAGADPNLVAEGFRWSALGRAATRTDADAVRMVLMLLAAGADVCVRMPGEEPNSVFEDLYGGLRPIEIAQAVGNQDVESVLALADRECS